MAIINKDDIGSTFKAGTESTQQGTASTQEDKKFTRPTPTGTMGFASGINAPMGRFSTSENVTALKDAIEGIMVKHFDSKEQLNSFRVIAADKNKVDIGNVSCVLITQSRVANGVNHISVQTLMIEKTAPALSPTISRYEQMSFENVTTVADLFDQSMANRINKLVTQSYGGNVEVTLAGTIVVPDTMDMEDEAAMHGLVFSCVNACYAELDNRVPFGGLRFKVSDINASQENLSVDLNYNPDKVLTATGEPVRSDISITLQSKMRSDGVDGVERVLDISRLDTFVDLMYSQPTELLPNGQLPTQMYYPRVVITKADTLININTLELQLLNLAQASILAMNSAWMGAFKPNRAKKGVDVKDIGGIGWDIPVTADPSIFQNVDTKTQEFTEAEFYQFMKKFVHDTPIISFDIEEAGETAWLDSDFILAATGAPESYQNIITAANNLTNNFFEKHWGSVAGPETSICDIDNRVHLGYYVDENNEAQDIRDLDYLAVMNLVAATDKPLITRWEESYSRFDRPMEERLQDRSILIKNFLPQAKIKRYGQRVTFTPQFITALGSALRDAGLHVQPNNVHKLDTGAGSRGYANANAYALNTQQTNSMFQTHQSSAQVNNAFNAFMGNSTLRR